MPGTLPSASADKTVLAEFGSQFNPQKLYEGGKKILVARGQDDAALAPLGFDLPWAEALDAALEVLLTSQGQRTQTKAGARPSGEQASAALDGLETWVNQFEGRVHAAVPPLSDVPALPRFWKSPAQITTAATPLVDYAAKQGGQSHPLLTAAFASEGKQALENFKGLRLNHREAVAALSPEVLAMHQAEGVVAEELSRLASVAKNVVPHDRAHLYNVGPFRAGSHVRKHADASSGTPAPKS